MSGTRPAALAEEALALLNITRRFGAVTALDDASMTVRAGTVHALLGENGAGKTTLMRIAFGMLPPDAGVVRVGGEARIFRSPHDAIAAGVGMVHQHFTLVPAMTVAENLALGGRGPYSAREAARTVDELSEATGFALDPRAIAGALSVGAQQRVEIAKALARRARVLVLDEPTGVLAPAEVDDLLRWVRTYVDRGHAVVLITHKLREAVAVADEVTVLRRGVRIMTARAADATERSLTAAMIGGEIAEQPVAARPTAAAARAVFRAQGVTVHDAGGAARITDASFQVDAGELVGVVGVEGSGQRELLRALAGRAPVSHGVLEHPAVVGFVPEDRHGDAVLLDRTLAENVALRGLGRARGIIRWTAVRDRTRALLAAFDVRAAGPDTPMRALSGGNQQKLVLARELGDSDGTGIAALVVENPTRGLDVQATAAVHARLRDAAARGAAVVLYSSDLDEVLSLASRVLVVFDGRVSHPPTNRDAIGRAMLGLTT